jgi:hypothetical protein
VCYPESLPAPTPAHNATLHSCTSGHTILSPHPLGQQQQHARTRTSAAPTSGQCAVHHLPSQLLQSQQPARQHASSTPAAKLRSDMHRIALHPPPSSRGGTWRARQHLLQAPHRPCLKAPGPARRTAPCSYPPPHTLPTTLPLPAAPSGPRPLLEVRPLLQRLMRGLQVLLVAHDVALPLGHRAALHLPDLVGHLGRQPERARSVPSPEPPQQRVCCADCVHGHKKQSHGSVGARHWQA